MEILNGCLVLCEIWGSYSSVAEDLSLLGFYAVPLDNWYLLSQWNMKSSYVESSSRRRRQAQFHIPED